MPHQFFPPHKSYENYIFTYQRYTVANDGTIESSPTEIHCKKFMRCSDQPEGYVDVGDIIDSIHTYAYLNDQSALERYSITVIGENKFYADLPVWEERIY